MRVGWTEPEPPGAPRRVCLR